MTFVITMVFLSAMSFIVTISIELAHKNYSWTRFKVCCFSLMILFISLLGVGFAKEITCKRVEKAPPLACDGAVMKQEQK